MLYFDRTIPNDKIISIKLANKAPCTLLLISKHLPLTWCTWRILYILLISKHLPLTWCTWRILYILYIHTLYSYVLRNINMLLNFFWSNKDKVLSQYGIYFPYIDISVLSFFPKVFRFFFLIIYLVFNFWQWT